MINNIGIESGDPEKDNNGGAICTSTSNPKPPAAPAYEKLAGVPPETSGPGSAGASPTPVLPSYSVGKGVSLPFGQLLPQCRYRNCTCNALIAWSNRSDPKKNGVLCLDHGLVHNTDIRRLALKRTIECRYCFISPEHEAALRAFLVKVGMTVKR